VCRGCDQRVEQRAIASIGRHPKHRVRGGRIERRATRQRAIDQGSRSGDDVGIVARRPEGGNDQGAKRAAVVAVVVCRHQTHLVELRP
jgi:hypothetical protein